MRRAAVVAALLGLLVVTGRPMTVRAEGSPFDAVNAQASADAVRVQYSVKKFIIVEDFVDAGGPTAQARLNTSGAQGFAALPDPGGLVLGYNTFVGLALGQGLPVDYPLYASATYPGTAAKETADPAGAYKVSAKAGADDADAVAQMQPSSGDAIVTGAVAHSTVKRAADTVSATAESGADLVTLAKGAVKIAGVHSRSVTTRTAGHSEPDTKTSLDVDLITVKDLRVRYGEKGFELLGSPVPVPSDAVAKALAEALKPLGLQIGVASPEAVTDGARAAVLEVRQLYALPFGNSQLILRFGGTISAVSAEDVLPAPAVAGAAPTDGGSAGGDSGAPPAVSAAGSSTEPAPGSAELSAPLSGSNGASGGAGSYASPSGSTVGSDAGFAPAADAAPAATPALGGTALGAGAPASPPPVNLATTAPAASHHNSVEGPYVALVVLGLGAVLASAEWSRRTAAAASWGVG